LIQEREAEIREIETGIHELNEIFRDLGTLVDQGSMLGEFTDVACFFLFQHHVSIVDKVLYCLVENIESNVTSTHRDIEGANEELGVASEYQRKAGKRAICLMIVVVIVICIVLLAVSIALAIIVL
jgi:t-SNARE complex subunit (syntaxin)